MPRCTRAPLLSPEPRRGVDPPSIRSIPSGLKIELESFAIGVSFGDTGCIDLTGGHLNNKTAMRPLNEGIGTPRCHRCFADIAGAVLLNMASRQSGPHFAPRIALGAARHDAEQYQSTIPIPYSWGGANCTIDLPLNVWAHSGNGCPLNAGGFRLTD